MIRDNQQHADAGGAGAVAVNVAQHGTATIYQYVVRLSDQQLGFIAREADQQSDGSEPDVCPYLGLETFQTSDAKFFAGRDDEIDELIAAVDSHQITGLIAASGSGKSSLVNAGLIPAFGARENEKWDVFAFRPGREPLKSLSRAISGILEPNAEHDSQLGVINARVENLRSGKVRLRDHVELLKATRADVAEGKRHQILLYVDQWEELYTQPDREKDRTDLLRELLDVTERGLAKVILTMRADFMSEILDDNDDFLQRLKPGICYLEKMTEPMLRQAIKLPAKKTGLKIPKDLVTRLVKDTKAQPGALPYLQFVLRQLWEERDKVKGRLASAAYSDMNGLKGAIGAHAQKVLSKLEPNERLLAERVIPRLVNVSEAGKSTSRRQLFAEFEEDARLLLRKLAEPDKRLIVLSSSVDRSDEREILAEIAHEALLDDWEDLNSWIAQRGDFFRLRNKLEADAKTWINNNRTSDFLVPSGKPLFDAQDLLVKALKGDTSKDLEGYLDTSFWKDRSRRWTRNSLFVALLSVASGLATYFAYLNENLQTTNAQLEEQTEFANVAREEAQTNAGQAELAKLEAEKQTAIANAAEIRAQENLKAVQEQRAILVEKGKELELALIDLEQQTVVARKAAERANDERDKSDAARLLAEAAAREAVGRKLGAESLSVVSNANRLEEFELAAALALEAIQRYPTASAYQAAAKAMQQLPFDRIRFYGAEALAFSLDGSRFVVAGGNKANVISVSEGGSTIPLQHTMRAISHAAFSEDGNEVVLLGFFGEIEAFHPTTGNQIRALNHDGSSATGISADGIFFVSKDLDGTANVYETTNGNKVFSISTNVDSSVATVLNSTGGVVDVDSSDVLQTFFSDEEDGHRITALGIGPSLSGSINSINMSQDNDLIVVSAGDGTVRIIERRTGEEVFKLFRSIPEFATFSPDGNIAVVSQDLLGTGNGYPEIIDYRTGNLISTFQHTDYDIRNIVFPHDSSSVAMLNFAGGVSLLDIETGHQSDKGRVNYDWDAALAFAYDGGSVAIAVSNGEKYEILRGASLEGELKPEGVPQSVTALEFSLDGKALMIGGNKGHFRFIDSATGRTFDADIANTVVTMAASPDANSAVATDDQKNICRIYFQPSLQPDCVQHESVVTSITFSTDGTNFTTEDADDNVTLFDFETMHEIGKISVNKDVDSERFRVSNAFFEDQARIAIGGLDGSVEVLDVLTGKTIAHFQTGAAVTDISFSQDGSRILVRNPEASMTNIGNFRIYDVSYQNLDEYICKKRIGRNLTQAEWQRYIGTLSKRRPTCQEWRDPDD